MFEWLFRPKKAPPSQPDQFGRHFRRAQQLIAQRNAGRNDVSAEPAVAIAVAPTAAEIVPSGGPELPAVEYTPASVSHEARLASALESVLQGNRVAAEVFTALYRGGYVFKESDAKWAITQSGKDLIERHKLYLPDLCLVAGVPCDADWSRRP